MAVAFIFMVAGIGSLVAGLLAPLPLIQRIAAASGGVILVLVGMLVAWVRLYVKTSANLAFVRTGSGGARPVLDGGAVVIPVVHNVIRISLETMKLDVERTGEDALITKDNLRVDVRGEFYIKVDANRDDILAAARSLGERGTHPDAVSALVFEKLVSALRSVAATMDLVEIHSRREDFAKAVFESVREDLKHNGLTLESVTISRLDQTDPRTLSDDNIFDAQGKKKITEITQAALVERNRLTRDAERERTAKDVETRQEILTLERTQAQAEATQATEVANVRAAKLREQKMFELEQQRSVREAQIAMEQSVQQAQISQELQVQAKQIERDRELIVREQEKQQTDIGRQQAIETAKISQQQTVEVAERVRQVAVAQKEAERAEAERKALAAQAERERANQQVQTVTATAEAEREAATRLIAAKQLIEQDKLKRQTDAEVQAFTQVREAEARREAAQRDAEARLQLAEAEGKSKERAAQADQAQRMVEVTVERERVNVEQARVEVERQGLENRQTFAAAAIDFEQAKLSIQAARDIQVAMADAIGQLVARGNFQIYGDPSTLGQMMNQLSKGLGFGAFAEGLIGGAPEALRELASNLGDSLKPMLESAAVAKSNGDPSAPAEPAGAGPLPAVVDSSEAPAPPAAPSPRK